MQPGNVPAPKSDLDDLDFVRLRDLADTAVLIAVSLETGLFSALHSRPGTVEQVARSLAFDERALRLVLIALADTGLVIASDGVFSLSERAARELGSPDAPDFAGGGFPQWLRSLRATTRLGEVLERGGPLDPRPAERSPQRAAHFTAAMAAAPRARLERLVDLCLSRHPNASNVLDIGGGPGHITRLFIERGLRGTLLDTADILEHAGQAYGLDAVTGLNVVAADFNKDPLPKGPFDIVLLSNVLHIYGPDTVRALLRAVSDVLSPHGLVAIQEFLLGRSPHAGRLGLRMLLKSEDGEAYSSEQLGGWLSEAGIHDLRIDELDPERQLMTGIRR